jgi:hypothetical protein
MQLFPSELSFTPGDVGFNDKDENGQPLDLLGRAETGKQLSELVERFSQPLVIAFDGAWGSGKSHFLKLWTGAHGKENGGSAHVIYFDAFEHDFLDDPLTSLIGAIAAPPETEPKYKTTLDTVRTLGAKLARPALRVAVAAATAGGTEIAAAVLDPLIAATGKELDSAVNNFWRKQDSRRTAMAEFRKALGALTTGADDTPRKLVFIIDELDRCRPDFALNLLEIIKHFFAVPNVHFVLGTNLGALQSSVRARYGHDFNAVGYLQKFVHLTMSLPTKTGPNRQNDVAMTYFNALCGEFGITENLANALAQHIEYVAKARDISLRDIERIVGNTLLVARLETIWVNYRHLLISAVLLRVFAPEMYRKLRSKKFTADDFLTFYGFATTAPPVDRGFEKWSREFWQAAFDGSGSDGDFAGMLRDYHFGDRKEYVEHVLHQFLDTFQFTSTT